MKLQLPMDEIAKLCRQYHVRELSVFGSVLREDFGPTSDVDFLVEFEPGERVTLLTLFELQSALANLAHREVDLVTKAGLKPRIKHSVLTSSEVVYAA